MSRARSVAILCDICGGRSGAEVYNGPIRTGRFGSYTEEAHRVLKCTSCSSAFLESAPAVNYESVEYRRLVDGGSSVAAFRELHDGEQVAKLKLLDIAALRGAVVADIGSGAGALLDLLRGVASRTIAIEPAQHYHEALRAGGHDVFHYCTDVPDELRGQVDLACCFSVIEHVEHPVAFLRDARRMLKPGGELVLTTPNANDWLLEVQPEAYGRFFYRVVHRWYLDAAAVRSVAGSAGFDVVDIGFLHRYDLANMIVWLRDGRPSGLGAIPVGRAADAAFCSWLEEAGRSDYLVARMKTK
ncbi:MAG TPA: class I SAM-dependent methyltransferase [Longimicrobiales bacterium]|nr:class I SAM-dependent methyltransferase [Longimicrobiales bacterium]